MSLLKRFAFWLPLLSVINYIGELIFNPVKDMVFVLDPFLGLLFNTFGSDGVLYDNENFKILFPGFLIHFSLWLIYGVVLDYVIGFLFREKG